IVNAFRLTFNRTAIRRTNKEFFDWNDLGVKMYSSIPHYMLINVTGGFSLGGPTESKTVYGTNSFQIADDVSLVRGTHQFGFGTNAVYWRYNSLANTQNGTQSFTGQATGLGLADFLLGRTAQVSQGGLLITWVDRWYVGAYAQDTWKAT